MRAMQSRASRSTETSDPTTVCAGRLMSRQIGLHPNVDLYHVCIASIDIRRDPNALDVDETQDTDDNPSGLSITRRTAHTVEIDRHLLQTRMRDEISIHMRDDRDDSYVHPNTDLECVHRASVPSSYRRRLGREMRSHFTRMIENTANVRFELGRDPFVSVDNPLGLSSETNANHVQSRVRDDKPSGLSLSVSARVAVRASKLLLLVDHEHGAGSSCLPWLGPSSLLRVSCSPPSHSASTVCRTQR